GYKFAFPRDHASHDQYKTEWWYFTGHLNTAKKRQFGYELTFFRTALDQEEDSSSPWNLRNIYLAHFAITDPDGKKFFFRERINRAGVGFADARQDVPYVYNQDWSMKFVGEKIQLQAHTPEYSLNLTLSPKKVPTIHGKNGVSQKASCRGCASHYYSLTRLETEGTLALNGQSQKVSGLSWMDHEFGSNQLTDQQVGWDWFSLQLDNNCEVMLYLMRNADGSLDPNSSGTITMPDGTTKHLALADFSVKSLHTWHSIRTGGNYPLDWTVEIPAAKAKITVTALMSDQELVTTGSTGVTYWEGASSVSGSWNGTPASGDAYVEMTGYAEKFKNKI
ncbi:MAG: lipocalin-like domain-containing protein, partial [Terriglobales bacterium]